MILRNVFVSSFGLALLQAEMKFKDKWLAAVSLGEQTFRTAISDQLSILTSFYLFRFFVFWIITFYLFNYL